jgi:hypothetical protein
VTGPTDTTTPPVIDDPNPGWRTNVSEWLGYYWQRLHEYEAATWPPPWGPSALAMAALAAFVLIVGGLLVPAVRGMAGFVLQGGEWARSTAAADIVLQPVQRYLHAHATGLPISAETLWWTWCFSGIALFIAASLSRSPAARLGWFLFGAASAAMVYSAAAVPTKPVAAGLTALWWTGLSAIALRPRPATPHIIVDVPSLNTRTTSRKVSASG